MKDWLIQADTIDAGYMDEYINGCDINCIRAIAKTILNENGGGHADIHVKSEEQDYDYVYVEDIEV